MGINMIQNVLNRYSLQSAHEVQFRMGYRTTFKKNREWIEGDSEILNLSEWEDLKDLCLKSEEKIFLETKGYLRGVYTDQKNSWSFSFVEWKDTLKAYFSLITKASSISYIQNPVYWEALKNESGIHLITGAKQSGKSTLLTEILGESKKDSPQQIVVHAEPSVLTQLNDETIFQLGSDAAHWNHSHPFYDGTDIIVVDLNDLQFLEKWIQFSESGLKIFITISSTGIENAIMQIRSFLNNDMALWVRFVDQISTVLNQKIIGLAEGVIHEILILKNEQRKVLLNLIDINSNIKNIFKKEIESLNYYQSYNQSILQAIVRRRIDVKTAFSVSNDPDDLDQQLKKMGL